MELHDEKYVEGTQKLCEFKLKEFSCKGLLVNFEGTEEFVRFRWSFELQEFKLHEFNCKSLPEATVLPKELSKSKERQTQ